MSQRVSRLRHGRRVPPVSRRASRQPTAPLRRRTAHWRGRRTTLPGSEPVPYTGADYSADVYTGPTDARPPMAFTPGEEPQYEAEPAPLPWYKRPPILFGAAAVAALLAIGGLAITLTGNSGVLGPVTGDKHDLLPRPVIRAAADTRRADDRHGDRVRRPADHHHRSRRHRLRRRRAPRPPPRRRPRRRRHDHNDHDNDDHHNDHDHDDHDDVSAGTQTTAAKPEPEPAPQPPADGA